MIFVTYTGDLVEEKIGKVAVIQKVFASLCLNHFVANLTHNSITYRKRLIQMEIICIIILFSFSCKY